MAFSPEDLERARGLLCRLEGAIQVHVIEALGNATYLELAAVADVTEADTLYQIDQMTESVVLDWFRDHWPAEWPVELVMEGLERHGEVVFPEGAGVASTVWKCIVDPVDGTRNIMYDKRSAWALAALAPQRGAATHLGDILVAALTELPTSKQWRADQISGVRGCGREGLVAELINLQDSTRHPLRVEPSQAGDFMHGFASFSRFFPEGKTLTAQIEEALWERLYGVGGRTSPVVFEDQYTCTGGQLYELMVGHDRMLGDLRPVVYEILGYERALVCHPYDACALMLLEEVGGVVEKPTGGPLDAPLDTVSPVAWVGFANPGLADQVRPQLHEILRLLEEE